MSNSTQVKGGFLLRKLGIQLPQRPVFQNILPGSQIRELFAVGLYTFYKERFCFVQPFCCVRLFD